jgi:transglutaminase-like putative cysteine protease
VPTALTNARRRFLWRTTILTALGCGLLANPTRGRPVAGSKRIRFTLEISNPSDAPLQRAQLRLFGPIATAVHHRLKSVRASWDYQEIIDSIGNRELLFTLGELGPYQTILLAVDFEMSSERSAPHVPNPSDLSGVPLIESYDPEIRALANSLRRSTEKETVESFFGWLVKNVEYSGYVAEDLGALYAVQQRRGDCTEFAYAAAALCRAVGIPSRVLGGYVLERDASRPRPEEYHNWAEIYVDRQWMLFDAQRQVLGTEEDSYIPFRIVSPSGSVAFIHRFAATDRVMVMQR